MDDNIFDFTWNIKNFSLLLSNESILHGPTFENGNVMQQMSVLHRYNKLIFQFFMPVENCDVSFISDHGELKLVPVSSYPFWNYSTTVEQLMGDRTHSILPSISLTILCTIRDRRIKQRGLVINSVLQEVNFNWSIEKGSIKKGIGFIHRQDPLQLTATLLPDAASDDVVTHKVIVMMMGLESKEEFLDGRKLSFVRSNLFIPTTCGCSKLYGRFIATDISCSWDIKIPQSACTPILLKFKTLIAVHGGETSDPQNVEKVLALVETCRDDFLKMYQGKFFSDATLNTEGRSFPVHKNILSARSPVFRKMFESEHTTEGRSGIVDIHDLDSETVDRMLMFMYSDSLRNLEWGEDCALFYAADKYEVPILKHKCGEMLEKALSVSNVCTILALADRHADETLLESAMSFVKKWTKKIMTSTHWKKLEESNSLLALRVTKKILLNN